VIGLFVWLIEPRWCVIKFVLNKYMSGYFVAVGQVFFTCELQTVNMCSNYFKLFYQSVADFMPFCIKMLCHGFHDLGSKVWSCYIQFCVITDYGIMRPDCTMKINKNFHSLIKVNSVTSKNWNGTVYLSFSWLLYLLPT